MKSATDAADPLDDPPGVRFKSSGLRVREGWKFANSVVTALPSNTAPALRLMATHAASALGQ